MFNKSGNLKETMKDKNYYDKFDYSILPSLIQASNTEVTASLIGEDVLGPYDAFLNGLAEYKGMSDDEVEDNVQVMLLADVKTDRGVVTAATIVMDPSVFTQSDVDYVLNNSMSSFRDNILTKEQLANLEPYDQNSVCDINSVIGDLFKMLDNSAPEERSAVYKSILGRFLTDDTLSDEERVNIISLM